jgi:hypothetical protein
MIMNYKENRKVKKGIISTKIYFDRARMYLGYINFFMLNLVLLNSSENGFLANMVNQNRIVWIPVLFVFYAAVLVFIGFLDTKLGFRQEEMRNNAMHNPILMDMINSINEIKKEVKKDRKND